MRYLYPMSRLPIPGSDDGQWGQILNDYLSVAHEADGSLKDGIPQAKIANLSTDLANKADIGTAGYRGPWSGASAYVSGDVVLQNGISYGAVQASTNQSPTTSTELITATPATPDGGDGAGYEMGVKFTVSRNIRLTGVTFYKASTNTGTHTARLWRYRGADAFQINSAVFSGETASGWQVVPLYAYLEPGYTYVASVYMPNGHYSVLSHGYDNPLTVGSVTAPVGAGVFTTGIGNVPTSVFNNNNYYVSIRWEEPDETHWMPIGRPEPLPNFPLQREDSVAAVAASIKANVGTLNFGTINAGATATQTILVGGTNAGNAVAIAPPVNLDAGLIPSAIVTDLNTVVLRLTNVTGSPITPAVALWKVTVIMA